MITRTLTRALAGVALAAIAAPAFAGSFYLQEQSTRGAGRAYSGEAADTGVSSLWWNPAAIARSGRELYVGFNGLLLDSEVRDAGSTLTYPGGVTAPVRGEAVGAGPIESGLVPNAGFAMPVGDRFAVGLAVQAPYNFTTKYNENAFSRYDALTSELRTVNVGVVGAVQVTDWLDLGVGVDAQYADARLGSALPNLSPLLPDGRNQLEGDGWNYGWNAGAQAHFGRLDLGLGYRSEIEHELDGNVAISGLVGPLAAANVATEGEARFTTPWFAFLSARYALTDKLTLNGQVNRIGWSEFDAIRVDYGTGGDVIVQDYKDVTTGAIGLDYKVDDITTLRAGVAYDPTPTRDDERTARIPDGDRWLYSAGATFQARPGLSIDAAVTYIDFKDAGIDSTRTFYQGTAAATTSRLLGEAEGNGVGVSLGARWAF
jgi:long-chain fatty acid transport protein